MSHITVAQTVLAKEASVERALNYLGIEFSKKGLIRTWGEPKQTDFALLTPFTYDIGLRKNKSGRFEIEADHLIWAEIARTRPGNISFWSRVVVKDNAQATKAKFIGMLQQAYALAEAVATAESQGHKIEVTEPDADGVIHARVYVGD